MSLLSDWTKLWGTTKWERQSPLWSTAEVFATELRKVFDYTVSGQEAVRGLLNLRQGKISTESKWNSPSLYDAFYHGLSKNIKEEPPAQKLPSEQDPLVERIILINNHMRERKREIFHSKVPDAHIGSSSVTAERVKQPHTLPLSAPKDSEPLRSSLEETVNITWRIATNCPTWTLIASSSSKRRGSPVIQRALVGQARRAELPSLHAMLLVDGQTHSVSVFIDPGADTNFLDSQSVPCLSHPPRRAFAPQHVR